MDSIALRAALDRLARNQRWTWVPAMRRLWAGLDDGDLLRHPVGIVADATPEALDELLADSERMALVTAESEVLDDYTSDVRDPAIAYFSPEFGLSDVVPQYSGGLGILAGDHLKASSDLRVPLVGVGLFYREGFFSQSIESGIQHESYPEMTPEQLAAADTGTMVEIPFPGRKVSARVWRMDVGRVPLILLDTDVAENAPADRKITDRLYGGDRQHRLEQELVLGVGGARALAALGWSVAVHHLNEGHAGFLVLELLDRVIAEGDIAGAVETVRRGVVFTTHTPVPAGIDRFAQDLIAPYLAVWAEHWGVAEEAIWRLGADPEDPTKFNMAAMGLRSSSSANGVSQLHGEVSRKLFAGVGIGDRITAITNGVHARTWASEDNQAVFDRVLGPEWARGDQAAWNRVDSMSDGAIGALRHIGSLRLAELVHVHTGVGLDPEALIVGFARRFATYKRATLLFQHAARLEEMLANDARPIHFVFAGKAHPADVPGKQLLADIVEFAASPAANGRFTFIPDYGIEIARGMYEGADVWLNTPVRPREASGTSGEKSALNGGLNCSILDGWWAEMFDSSNGWAIQTSDKTDPAERDVVESAATLDVLDEILAEYHDNPLAFIARIRQSWRSLGPQVTSARMVDDYRKQVYVPALSRVG